MASLSFEIPGPPRPAGRPRSAPLMRQGCAVMRANGRPVILTHKPKRSCTYEHLVAVCALAAASAQRWKVPKKGEAIYVDLKVFRKTRTGDIDNFAKAVLDGITKSRCVWIDDRQVVSANMTMGVDRARPRVEVVVRVNEIELSGVRGMTR